MRAVVVKLNNLLTKYPDLGTDWDKIKDAKGHFEENLSHFDLSKKELKRLESEGRAIGAHKPSKTGSRRVWILVHSIST